MPHVSAMDASPPNRSKPKCCAPIFSLLAALLLSFCAVVQSPVHAADDAALNANVLKLASEDNDAKKAAIEALGNSADMRMIPVLDNYNKANLYLYKNEIYIGGATGTNAKDEKTVVLEKPFSANAEKTEPILLSELKEIGAARRERGWVRDALVLLRLSDPAPDKRLNAVVRAGEGGGEANLAALQKLQLNEKDPKIKAAIEEAIALIDLQNPDAKVQIAAIEKLGAVTSARGLPRLKEMAATNKDPAKAEALDKAIKATESWQSTARGIGYTFRGLSMGSILVLMALGLSIIFGLMGVINMAHGELMMIGAYSTYLTQQAFVKYASPAAFDYYFLAAIPISFFVAGIVGYLIEISIVRFLYGRPLETLLATWGVSYILIQAVRVTFGDNIAVNSPSWLQGGAEVLPDVVLPYNRLFIIVFCLSTVLLMYWIIERTKLGLLLRATTQNRNMAGALGVNTRHIDGYTFGLGAGLAGMAGCALTQVGGVTPDMGQNYIVDSFLVVVTGGVGKLAGAIWAGLGLGFLNKFLEPSVQAVWAKVIILGVVVVFIQWRPSGLFPAKGRLADA